MLSRGKVSIVLVPSAIFSKCSSALILAARACILAMPCPRVPVMTAGSKPRPLSCNAIRSRWLWSHEYFFTSLNETEMIKIPRPLVDRFIDSLCYAA